MRRSAVLVLLALVAGCGGSSDRKATTTATAAHGPAGVRSAEHDARDATAEIAPESQGTEPNKGSPGVNDAIGGKVDVPIRDRRFTQRSIRLKVGQIVVFTNDDDVPHTVRAIGTPLPHSGLIPVGGRFEFTPLEPGRVRYRCVIHPRMQGMLLVESA